MGVAKDERRANDSRQESAQVMQIPTRFVLHLEAGKVFVFSVAKDWHR